MRLAVSVVLLFATLVAIPARTVAQSHVDLLERQRFLQSVDDAIADANGRDSRLLPPVFGEPSSSDAAATLADIFRQFFAGIAPNDTGIERPFPDERPIDEYQIDLGGRTSYALMGGANNHVITPLYFYQQYDGIHALRYDLVRTSDATRWRVALAVSPAYGSITTVSRHMGVVENERLPLSVVLGGAGGLDVRYDSPLIEFWARAWAMPGVDLIHEGRAGVEILTSVRMKWHITETFDGDPAWPIDAGVLVLYLDRGEARSAVYEWNNGIRSPGALRELWQIMTYFELRI